MKVVLSTAPEPRLAIGPPLIAIARQAVGQRDIGERHVAGVRHREGIADDLAATGGVDSAETSPVLISAIEGSSTRGERVDESALTVRKPPLPLLAYWPVAVAVLVSVPASRSAAVRA